MKKFMVNRYVGTYKESLGVINANDSEEAEKIAREIDSDLGPCVRTYEIKEYKPS